MIRGTGLSVKGEGIYRGVVLLLQLIEVVKDFLPLELGILGVKWLETLGAIHINWKTLTMRFKIGDYRSFCKVIRAWESRLFR